MDKHDWHIFDDRRGWEVCQVTGPGEPDEFHIRNAAGKMCVLDVAKFEQLREDGPDPVEVEGL